jgi:hypothetical protein
MGKLHELLAVASSLKGQSEKTRTGLMETFEKKRHHFAEKRTTFFPSQEGAHPVTEEQSDIQTTVPSEIAWLKDFVCKAMDAEFQVSLANTMAVADVELEDGTVILKAVPATALLELEKRMTELHAFANAIPTLDPAKGFAADSDRKNIYKAREVNKTRTKKIQRPLVMAPATEQHPAQVQLITEDVAIGRIQEQEWSGLITPASKADIISRIEDLSRAIKKARSRANDQVIATDRKIAATLWKHCFGA